MALLRCLTIAVFAAVLSAQGVQAGTLEDVQARGHVKCGVSQNTSGFSFKEQGGRWTGLDVNTCRAVAAAIFGDADKVVHSGLSSKEPFTALQSGEVDWLAQVTTWTLSRDAARELDFTGVTFYDGQGFMVRKELGLENAKELDGAIVCTTLGTTTELNLSDIFRTNNMELRTAQFENWKSATTAYERG